MVAFVASDFMIGGSPTLVRAGASEWLAFSSAADVAAAQISRVASTGSAGFIGPEGDLYRERLSGDLVPQLQQTYEAWAQVGAALVTFAAELEGVQSRMGGLLVRAETAASTLTAARGAASDATSSDAAHASARARDAAALPAGSSLPPDVYRSGAASANAKVTAAEADLQDCMADASALRTEHAAAVEVCRAAVAVAKDMAFEEPPSWLESAFDSVVDWVAENADVLNAIADVLDTISMISGMLSFIPGMAAVSALAGGGALLIHTVVDLSTGEFSAGSFAMDLMASIPGVKAVKGALGGAKEAVSVASVATDSGKVVLAADAAKAAAKGVDNLRAGATKGIDDVATAAKRTDGDAARLADETPSPADAVAEATPADKAVCASDPVDLVTGAVWLEQTDLELPGTLPMVLNRVHNSGFRYGQLFGRSWSSTLDQRVVRTEAGAAALITENGSVLHYLAGWDAPVGLSLLPTVGVQRWSLTRTVDGGFEVFDPLTRVTRKFLDPGGSDSAKVASIVDSHGIEINFVYGVDGDLQELTHPGYRVRIQVVDKRVQTISLVDGEGEDIQVASFDYDRRGLVTSVRNSSGLPLSYAYDDEARMVGWIDRNGLWYRYTYDEDGRCVRNGGRDNALKYAFDYRSGRTVVTNSLGAREVVEFNDAQQVVRRVDALGNETRFVRDPFDRIVTETNALGGVTSWKYDQAGAVTEMVGPGGDRLVVERDARSLASRIVDPSDAIWLQERDARGLLVAEIDPVGDRVTFGYDGHGAVVSVTDSLGGVMAVTRDAAGLVTAVTDPMGSTTRFERDAFGRVLRRIDATGGVTATTWSGEGKLLSCSASDGAVDTWEWDAEGNLLTHTNPMGAVTRFDNAVWDLPVVRVDPDGGRYQFTYDTELRMTAVTNPHGARWTYKYDAAGRLVTEVDFNGRRLSYEHDSLGRLAALQNASGQRSTFVYDAAGNLRLVQSPEGETRYRHDQLGRVVAADAPGVSLQFDRDALGRVLGETCNGRRVGSEFDQVGRKARRILPSGLLSEWSYDLAGNVAGLASAGHRVSFGYDERGRESSRSFAAGAQFDFTRDAVGRVLSESVTSSPAAQERAGSAIASRAYRYRADGGLISILEHVSGLDRRLDLDVMGRVTSLTRQTPSDGISFDPLSWTERYAYDVTGSVAQSSGPVDSGRRKYHGSQVTRVGRTRYGWDVDGRLVTRSRVRLSRTPEVTKFRYDSFDRLVEVTVGDGTRWVYTYDPFGRRISKRHLSQSGELLSEVLFTWDGSLLVEEVEVGDGGTRLRSWEYAQDDFRPIAQHAARYDAANRKWIDQQFHSVVTDLIGTPTELLTPDGRQIEWTLEPSTVWGAPVSEGGLPQRVSCPIRFPGQYLDTETGLHYNRHRYYDPKSNRYTSVDPLGLAPAPDAHGYVDNPGIFSDPTGLAACELPQPNVTSPKLKNIVQALYSGTTNPRRIGDGTTAAAVRHETETGMEIFGKTHEIKARALANGLNKLLKSQKLTYPDRRVAQTLYDELQEVLTERRAVQDARWRLRDV